MPGSRLDSSPPHPGTAAVAAKVCSAPRGLENSLGRARGLERGWSGQHLEAATGGEGLVQTNLSEE